MRPPASVGSFQDLFKMPHIQLSLKRPVLGLTEEHGKKIDELFRVVHLEGAPVLYPWDSRFEPFLLNVFHHLMQFSGKLCFRAASNWRSVVWSNGFCVAHGCGGVTKDRPLYSFVRFSSFHSLEVSDPLKIMPYTTHSFTIVWNRMGTLPGTCNKSMFASELSDFFSSEPTIRRNFWPLFNR